MPRIYHKNQNITSLYFMSRTALEFIKIVFVFSSVKFIKFFFEYQQLLNDVHKYLSIYRIYLSVL